MVMSRLSELVEILRALEEGHPQNQQKGLLQALQVPLSMSEKIHAPAPAGFDEPVEHVNDRCREAGGQPTVDGVPSHREAEKIAAHAKEGTCKTSRSTDPTSCAWCGEGERSGAMIVPFGTEATGHTWLHDTCWPAWYAKRRNALPAAAPAEH
jgi:hypothetical protein